MATYSRTGIGLTWFPNATESTPVDVALNAELTLYTPNDVDVLRYKQEEQPDGSFRSDLSLGGSAFYVGGNVVDLDSDAAVIGVLQWRDSDGIARSTTVLRVDLTGQDSPQGLRDFSFIFRLEGDEFPDFQEPADWTAFEAGITDFESAEGAFGPNTNIALEDFLQRVSDGNQITGDEGGDALHGTSGDDFIRPMNDVNLEGDYIQPGTGDDTVVLGANESGYVMLSHTVLDDAITVYLDGTQNIGRIEKNSGGVTSLVDPNTPDSLRIFGTAFDDVFNVTVDDDSWVSLRGNGGQDHFFLGESEGTVRLDLTWADSSGVVVDLAQGQVLDDGFGTRDFISGPGHVGELRTSMGNDVVTGSAEGESFILRGGSDTLDAGAGNDTLRYDNVGAEWVEADLSEGVATGLWSGKSFVHRFTSVEHLHGTDKGNDRLIGTEGNNVLSGNGGHDTLMGGHGHDTLKGGAGNDILDGGSGRDRLAGGGGIDELSYASNAEGTGVTVNLGSGYTGRGAKGDRISDFENLTGTDNVGSADFLTGNSDDNSLKGLSGNDQLAGGEGNDTLDGGDGRDTLAGGSGTDELSYVSSDAGTGVSVNLGSGYTGRGAAGDQISGFENLTGTDIAGSADFLTGTRGDNVLRGLAGNDRLDGGRGDDTLDRGSGRDILVGGSGADELSYASSETGTGVTVNLGSGYTGRGAMGDQISGFESLTGTNIAGSADFLTGTRGDNYLRGLAGNDHLNGGRGNDTLEGGTGDDALRGGSGEDTFIFSQKVSSDLGADSVLDFSLSQDVLVFDSSTTDEYADLTFENGQDGVHVHWAGGTVTLEGLSNADLGEEHFLFT